MGASSASPLWSEARVLSFSESSSPPLPVVARTATNFSGVVPLLESSSGYRESASALALCLPDRCSILRSSSCRAIPHLANLPEGCGVFRRDFKAS